MNKCHRSTRCTCPWTVTETAIHVIAKKMGKPQSAAATWAPCLEAKRPAVVLCVFQEMPIWCKASDYLANSRFR
jgi:hypothetical protein